MLCTKVCTDKELDEIETKDIILETVVSTLERVPSIVHSNKKGSEIVNNVVELILNHMISNISINIEEKWCKPPEG